MKNQKKKIQIKSILNVTGSMTCVAIVALPWLLKKKTIQGELDKKNERKIINPLTMYTWLIKKWNKPRIKWNCVG